MQISALFSGPSGSSKQGQECNFIIFGFDVDNKIFLIILLFNISKFHIKIDKQKILKRSKRLNDLHNTTIDYWRLFGNS